MGYSHLIFRPSSHWEQVGLSLTARFWAVGATRLPIYLGHQDLDFASMARCPPLKRCERRFLGILSILSQVVKVSGAGTRTSARSRIIGSGPSQPCGVCACLCVCTCVCGKERGAAACSELAQNPSWALSGNPQKCLCSGHSAAQLPANPLSESAPSAR